MNTLHLSYAVEVERCGSITQAAENLYMAQPNLSKAIKELEESMGFPIFARTSRGVLPTARGREFLVYARAILAQEQKMRTLSRLHDDHVQRFSLILPPSGYIAASFSRFLETLDMEKPMEINVQETSARQAVAAVSDGLFQMAVLRVDAQDQHAMAEYLKSKSLSSQTLWEYDALVLMSQHHPLAKAGRITENDLLAYPTVTAGEGFAPSGEGGLQAGDRAQRLELLRCLPLARMWSSPEPVQTLRRYNLVQRACFGSPPRFTDLLVCPADYTLSALDQRFLATVRETRDQLADARYV